MHIKIKDIQGKYATGKYQLLDPDANHPKKKQSYRALGYRALEAGEVIEVPDDEGEKFVKESKGILEMTLDAPTRPLLFSSIEHARVSSDKFPVNDEDRAALRESVLEQIKEAL